MTDEEEPTLDEDIYDDDPEGFLMDNWDELGE